jgi:hypothetical protein
MSKDKKTYVSARPAVASRITIAKEYIEEQRICVSDIWRGINEQT